MFKTLLPLVGILIAVGLFFMYIKPTFEDVRAIQDESAAYSQAVEKAAELERRVAELRMVADTIVPADRARLDALVPEQHDEIAVLNDLDTLARSHALTLGDIEVMRGEGGSGGASSAPVSASDQPAQPTPGSAPLVVPGGPDVATLDLQFSVTGTYADFRSFLSDMERSLAFMEVTEISFEASEGDAIPFMVTLRLYALPLTPV